MQTGDIITLTDDGLTGTVTDVRGEVYDVLWEGQSAPMTYWHSVTWEDEGIITARAADGSE